MASRASQSSGAKGKGGGEKKFYHATSQQAYYMKPSEAATVSLGGGPELGGSGLKEEERPKLGVVVMTKRPLDLEHWLWYHRSVVGVSRFYVQCEDSPELAALLLRPPWNAFVDATFVAKTERDYFVQMDRQAVHVACTVPRARAAGVEWLLHVDDDELLHCPSGAGALWRALKDAPKHVSDVHVKNVEALAPTAACSRPFLECTRFVASTSKFASYTNGKSFGRVAAPGLRAHGPHHFRGDVLGGANGVPSATLNVAASVAVVLHYESVSYDRWTTKFSELAARHGHDQDILDKLPFPFYRASLSAVGHLARCPDGEKGKARDAAFKVWSGKKVETDARVPNKDTILVTAVRDALAEGVAPLLGDAAARDAANAAPTAAPPFKKRATPSEAKPPPPVVASALPRLT